VCLLSTYLPSRAEGRLKAAGLCSMGHWGTLLFLDFVLPFLFLFSVLLQFAGSIGQQSPAKNPQQISKRKIVFCELMLIV